MRERRTDFARQLRLLHQDVPVEQQIVVVEQVLLLLDLHEVTVELRELALPLARTRERRLASVCSSEPCVLMRCE